MENDHRESEWISTVKIILKKLGLGRYFEQPGAITHEKLKELLSKRLHEKFKIKKFKPTEKKPYLF